jgi:hypothetical protein
LSAGLVNVIGALLTRAFVLDGLEMLAHALDTLLRGYGVREDLQVALQGHVSEVAVDNVKDCVCRALLKVTLVQEHDPIAVSGQLV